MFPGLAGGDSIVVVMTLSPPAELIPDLLSWYDENRRDLPWRVPPGRSAEPYYVWLSEIMLQQTTVATVETYFRHFVHRWPTVKLLANAPLDDVLHAWQGLGYYARARNLHKCARLIVDRHDGRFPDTEADLRALPGIGVYTAAAIAAIAFDQPTLPVDGNIERVIARLWAIDAPLPAAKPEIRRRAAEFRPARRSGDLAQAMMDLGAMVCLPRRAHCPRCPLVRHCRMAGRDEAATLPRKAPKKPKPVRRGVAFWLTRANGAVLLRRRPERGLLGGMFEIPSTEWIENGAFDYTVGDLPVAAADLATLPGTVRHTFTHFHLELAVVVGRSSAAIVDGNWVPPDRFGDFALPTVMKKVCRHALTRDRAQRLC